MTLACVVLAHADPTHLRRLVNALTPLPVFVHVDARTDDATHAAMTQDLPATCTMLPRIATGWARWENVAAELSGYRMALADPSVTHVALMTGSDYPLASVAAIEAVLAEHPQDSFAVYHPLPKADWGWSGGLARIRYPHWPWRKRMLRVPVRRRIPGDVVLAGGSQVKALARRHVQDVLAAVDARPELVTFWRRTWIPDESFVASVLSTPELSPTFRDHHQDRELWFIGWSGQPQKSPPWLRADDLDRLVAARADGRLFARKFGTAVDTVILDQVDEKLRG